MSLGVLAYAGRVLRSTEQSRRQLAEANQRCILATASDGIGLFEWAVNSDSLPLDARAGALFGLQVGPDGRSFDFGELRALLHPDDLQPVRDAIGPGRRDRHTNEAALARQARGWQPAPGRGHRRRPGRWTSREGAHPRRATRRQ